jgi:hypothetical protein
MIEVSGENSGAQNQKHELLSKNVTKNAENMSFAVHKISFIRLSSHPTSSSISLPR